MRPRAIFMASAAFGVLISSGAGANFNELSPHAVMQDISVRDGIAISPPPMQAVENKAAIKQPAHATSSSLTPVNDGAQGDLKRLASAVLQDKAITPPAGEVTPPGESTAVLSPFDALVHCAAVDLTPPAFAGLERAPAFDDLDAFYAAHGFSLKDSGSDQKTPPLFLTKLPRELANSTDIPRRKRLFISIMLPHVIAANAEIMQDRNRLINLIDRFDDPTGPSPQEIDWLFAKFADYGVKDYSVDRLLARIDVIPPALAIAQAAKESGWGGSRFAQAGNALYGQWTWNPSHKGIVPKERPKGKTYRVRAFDSVLDATRAYMLNLNANRAYGQFRERRLQRRKAEKPLTGVALTEKLEGYSAIGERYVRALKSLIRHNGLVALNTAELGGGALPGDAQASPGNRAGQDVFAQN